MNKAFVKRDGTIKLYDIDISELWLASLVYAHIGWWVENLFRLSSKHILDSRNQILPFLFCYSIALWAMYFMLGTTHKTRFFSKEIISGKDAAAVALRNIYYFTVTFLFVFFGEIVVGSLFEKISGIQLWNYNGIPLHVTQYTSVPKCAAISFGVMVMMGNLFEGLMKLIKIIPKSVLIKTDWVLGALVVADWIYMMVSINVFKKAPAYWSIQF